MNIQNRQKYSNGYSNVNTEKIGLNFDLQVLDLMCSYTISENSHIRKSHLVNLRNLVNSLDMNLYINDPEKMSRLTFIKKGLEGRIVRGLKNTDAIIKYASGGFINDNIIAIAQLPLLSTEEMNWVNDTVSESLKYNFIYEKSDRLKDLLIRFDNGEYTNKSEIVEQIEQCVTEMAHDFRRSKAESMQDMTFSLRPDKFEDSMHDIYDKLTNTNRKLLTGMQGFNLMTNGGYESGRVYGYFGITGIGKSMTLLNIARQIKKYNRNYQTKDPTKIPCIVIHTMENDVTETVKRLYDISTGAPPQEFRSLSYDEVLRRLKEDGELYLSDDNPIDIVIKYTPSGSIDTSYMYTLCEELEEDGYEVICYIQDHLKKMRSQYYKNADIRIELGEIINEMKAFAIAKDIPVITNSHLNRDACAKLEAAAQSSKADLTRSLGKANIGESMLILDNIDLGFYVNLEYDDVGNKYLCVATQKKRDYVPIEYIAHPFANPDSIQLLEDFNCATPLFKDTLRQMGEMNIKEVNRSAYSNMKMLFDEDEDSLEDIFSNATVYNIDDAPDTPIMDVNIAKEECVEFVKDSYTNLIDNSPVLPEAVVIKDMSKVLEFIAA